MPFQSSFSPPSSLKCSKNMLKCYFTWSESCKSDIPGRDCMHLGYSAHPKRKACVCFTDGLTSSGAGRLTLTRQTSSKVRRPCLDFSSAKELTWLNSASTRFHLPTVLFWVTAVCGRNGSSEDLTLRLKREAQLFRRSAQVSVRKPGEGMSGFGAYLQWRALCRHGCEAHNVAEVNGDAVKRLGLHRLPSFQLLCYGAEEDREVKLFIPRTRRSEQRSRIRKRDSNKRCP